MECCGPSPEYEAKEKERRAKEEADMNREVTVNGVKLKIKDLYPDYWAAKDFLGKLNIIEKTQGGKELMNDSPIDILEEDAPAE